MAITLQENTSPYTRTAVTKTVAETVYVTVEGNIVHEVTFCFGQQEEDVPYFDGDLDGLNAAALGVSAGGPLVAATVFPWGAPGTTAFENTDEYKGQLPQPAAKMRTRTLFLRQTAAMSPVSLLPRWFWTDLIIGVSDVLPVGV